VRAYTKRYADPAAVLVLDIDNFKRINDRYGHPVGDQLLGALAHTLEQRSRETDVVGRLGGDEFGVILPRVAPAEAEFTAHALLEAVRRRVSVALDGKRIGTSASVGVRLIYPGCDLSAAELLAEADIALYDAKET